MLENIVLENSTGDFVMYKFPYNLILFTPNILCAVFKHT